MSVEVRAYTDQDEQGVLDTLQAAFAHWPGDVDAVDPRAYFRWKHLENPLGRSLMIVAVADGGVVGFCSWMPMAFSAGEERLRGVRGVDLAVRPEYRGQGLAGKMVAAGSGRIPPEIAFSLSNPNALSMGTVRRLGRRRVGRFTTFVRVRRPLRMALDRRSATPPDARGSSIAAEPAANALADDGLSSLLARVDAPDSRLAVVKDVEYVRWRYGALGLYHALRVDREGSLHGICIFRLRRHGAAWTTRICEVMVGGRDAKSVRRLLGEATRAADVDYATCHFPAGTFLRRASISCGFLPSRHGETVMATAFDPSLTPDPTDPRSWAVSLGDIDLL